MSTYRNSGRGAWARWKDGSFGFEDELDMYPELPPATQTDTTTPTNTPNPGPENTHLTSLLGSSLPELRIIGEHLQSGQDGHPFNTGDVVADTQPTSRMSY